MIERNTFDKAMRDLAIRHAPHPIARIGDVVIAQWGGWKQPHKVKITRIAVEIASIDLTIARREELGLTGWLIAQHMYIGRRIKANGELAGNPHCGFLLNRFTTADGKKYERILSGFNHAGLVFYTDEEVKVDAAETNKAN